MAKKRAKKAKAKTSQPKEPKPFQEVADDIDAYCTGRLLQRLGPDLWDLLDAFDSPIYTVSPGTDEGARIRPIADKLMLEQHVRGQGVIGWTIREWNDVKDELARPE